jgi:hypothetical protein
LSGEAIAAALSRGQVLCVVETCDLHIDAEKAGVGEKLAIRVLLERASDAACP